MLAHVPSFGRNPRGSPDFLAYPVPEACMHVLGTGVPGCLGVARSAPRPKAKHIISKGIGVYATPILQPTIPVAHLATGLAIYAYLPMNPCRLPQP